ncbi:MAG: hypothetical protein K6T26_07140 [Alicyclobacillus sp.]|nr:hypothetical protein [Alicyclobacillus sp.]
MKSSKHWGVALAVWLCSAGVLVGCGQGSSPSGNSNSSGGNPGSPANQAAPASPTTSAAANSAADFYKGKTLSVIVPSGAGGAYDQWARLLAPYLQKQLGVKAVDVVNVPGAGGLIGTRQIYSAAPDGLTIGITNAGGDVFNQIAGTPGLAFDVTKFNWIGRPDDDTYVMSARVGGEIQSFADLLKHKSGSPVRVVDVGVGTATYNADRIIFSVFGIQANLIAAYASSEASKAGFLRGDGDVTSLTESAIKPLVDSGKATIILAESTTPLKDQPQVPTLAQVAQQAHLNQDQQNLLTALSNVMTLGHSFFAPPGVPADRLAFLRQAFQQALQDPTFQNRVKQAGLEIGYASGDQLQQMVSQAMSESGPLKAILGSQSK